MDTDQPTLPRCATRVTGVILAGGRARRMGGRDKGLIEVGGAPMVRRVAERLALQVGAVLINANRNLPRYAELGYPVVSDVVAGYHGPLAGMASGLQAAQTPLVVTVPCDSPLLPGDLVARLCAGLGRDAAIAVAHDGERMQPVFSLLRTELLEDLRAWLASGERKIDRWYARHPHSLVDFSDHPETFVNVNTPEDRAAVESRLAEADR